MKLKELLMSPDVYERLWEMMKSGTIRDLEPTLADLKMEIPKGYHHKNNLDHSIRVLGNAIAREENGPDLILRTAALFHDIGKPVTREFHAKGKVSFTAHDTVGARMIKKILKRHEYSPEEIRLISILIKLHMRSHTFKAGWSDSAVRRLITDVETSEQLDRLCIIFFADVTTKNETKMRQIHKTVDILKKEMKRVKQADARAALRPAMNGYEIMELFGLEQGKELGAIMKFLNSDEGIKLSRQEVIDYVTRVL